MKTPHGRIEAYNYSKANYDLERHANFIIIYRSNTYNQAYLSFSKLEQI